LAAVFVVATGKIIDAAQERAAHTVRDAVVVGGIGETDLGCACLRHAGSLVDEGKRAKNYGCPLIALSDPILFLIVLVRH